MTEQVIVNLLICGLVVVPVSTVSAIRNRAAKTVFVVSCLILAWLASFLLSREAEKANATLIMT